MAVEAAKNEAAEGAPLRKEDAVRRALLDLLLHEEDSNGFWEGIDTPQTIRQVKVKPTNAEPRLRF